MEDSQQHQRPTEDPFELALKRLRDYPEFGLLIEDLRETREEKLSQLGETTDPNRQQQIVGEISVLHDMANTYEGDA